MGFRYQKEEITKYIKNFRIKKTSFFNLYISFFENSLYFVKNPFICKA